MLTRPGMVTAYSFEHTSPLGIKLEETAGGIRVAEVVANGQAERAGGELYVAGALSPRPLLYILKLSFT
jgi:hypothetical protein